MTTIHQRYGQKTLPQHSAASSALSAASRGNKMKWELRDTRHTVVKLKYLALDGPKMRGSNEELAEMASSGISPECMPNAARHRAANNIIVPLKHTE